MKKILFIFVCTLIFGTTSAQDIILKKNADEIPAKVLKIGNTEIEYKKWSNIDGPLTQLQRTMFSSSNTKMVRKTSFLAV